MCSPWRFPTCLVPALPGLLLTIALAAGAPPPATTQAAAAARKDRRSTAHDLYRQSVAYNQATLRGAYDQVGKRDPKWDGRAREFLDVMARYFSNRSVHVHYLPPDFQAIKPQALQLGRAALDAYCYAAALQDAEHFAEAEPLLYKSFDGMLASDYPATRLRPAAGRTARTAAAAPGGKRELLALRAHSVAVGARVRAACEKLDEGGRRTLYRSLRDELESAPRAEQ